MGGDVGSWSDNRGSPFAGPFPLCLGVAATGWGVHESGAQTRTPQSGVRPARSIWPRLCVCRRWVSSKLASPEPRLGWCKEGGVKDVLAPRVKYVLATKTERAPPRPEWDTTQKPVAWVREREQNSVWNQKLCRRIRPKESWRRSRREAAISPEVGGA
jgi:hypothetical protein